MDILHNPFRVAVDGTVTVGVKVAEATRNRPWCSQEGHPDRGLHTHAYPPNTPPTAHGNRHRYNAGIPRDLWLGDRRTDILGVTHPHDCANHLPESSA
jgi:hypothetical protein